MTTFRNYLNERLEDPEFRKVWEESQPDYQIVMAIAKARAKSGMTQKELAEKSGIIQAEISKMENGNANPSLKTLKKLAAGMNMKLVISFEPLEDTKEIPLPVEVGEPEYEMV